MFAGSGGPSPFFGPEVFEDAARGGAGSGSGGGFAFFFFSFFSFFFLGFGAGAGAGAAAGCGLGLGAGAGSGAGIATRASLWPSLPASPRAMARTAGDGCRDQRSRLTGMHGFDPRGLGLRRIEDQVIGLAADQAGQFPYIVMELVSGTDLAEHIAANGPLEQDDAIGKMIDVEDDVAQFTSALQVLGVDVGIQIHDRSMQRAEHAGHVVVEVQHA